MKFKDIDLFIFDMDGLIFETEKLYLKILPEVTKELGYTPDLTLIHSTIGMNLMSMKKLYETKYGKAFPFELLSQKVYEKLNAHNEKYGLEIVDGVLEVLEYLYAKGKKCVIASSSNIEVIKKYIKRNKLDKYFCDYTAGNEIKNGKPQPDIFLLAAKKQNISPRHCMVFEDSYNGIRAGVNAHMHTIMIPNVQKANDEMKNISSMILKNIKEILMYI